MKKVVKKTIFVFLMRIYAHSVKHLPIVIWAISWNFRHMLKLFEPKLPIHDYYTI